MLLGLLLSRHNYWLAAASTTNVEKTAAPNVNLLRKYLNSYIGIVQSDTLLLLNLLEIIAIEVNTTNTWTKGSARQRGKGHLSHEYKGPNRSAVLNLSRNVGEALLDQSVTNCGATFRLTGLKSHLTQPVEAVAAWSSHTTATLHNVIPNGSAINLRWGPKGQKEVLLMWTSSKLRLWVGNNRMQK